MIRIAILLLVLSNFGCATHLKKTSYIYLNEEGLNEKTIEIIDEIKSEMHFFFNRDVLNVKKEDSRMVSIKYEKLDKRELGICECDLYTNSCEILLTDNINPGLAINDIDRQRRQSRLKLVLYHEIGHSFGLSHSNRLDDIMFESTKPRKLLKEEIERFLINIKKTINN